MHIYFSGIGGVGIGPLAELSYDAGYAVSGSDKETSPMLETLREKGLDVHIGQTREHIAELHTQCPIDWFVYTAALPNDHPELLFAQENNIRISKRDELLSEIIRSKQLKLIAVAGTHGKTTTTGMIVWSFQQLGIPLSYSVGTSLSFGPSGVFNKNSEYFVYECDEYDRNMLHFKPCMTIITSLDYDHPDTYINEHVYKDAFSDFIAQSKKVFIWEKDWQYLGSQELADSGTVLPNTTDLSPYTLPGVHMRQNASLVHNALSSLFPEKAEDVSRVLNMFPGTGRRFEKLIENLYTDYGHHPAEIAATLQLARELSDHIVLVYQPHQNVRQHELKNHYTDCMELADKVYWLPTYLSREDPNLPVLSVDDLTAHLVNRSAVSPADLDDALWGAIQSHLTHGELVLIMGAGSVDSWIRSKL